MNSLILLLLFAVNITIAILTIIKSRLSIFSFKTIVVNYILLPLLYQYIRGNSYGLLELGITNIHYELILLSLLIYNSIFYVLLLKTNILEDEKTKLKNEIHITGFGKFLLMLAAIVFTIIAFPTAPFSYDAATRFHALLPGHAWNHLAIICLIMLIGNLRKDADVQITYLFCIFWFLSHYERVDIVGLLIMIVVVFLTKKFSIKGMKLKNIAKLVIIGLSIFATMTYVGISRSGIADGSSLLKNLVVQKTASDVAYVYNISIDNEIERGTLNGVTYGQYLVELLPGLEYKNSVVNILKEHYPFPGGEYILSAPIMNFGIIGVPIMAIVEFTFLRWCIKSKWKITMILYLFVLATLFRTNWYGLSYIETGTVYVIPILYFIYAKVTNSLKIWSKDGAQ